MAKISVLGAGSWGTALSILLYNNGHEVILWSALGEEITTLREKREHVSKLPGVKIPEPIDITIDLERSLRDTDVAILAVPSPYTRSTCKRMAPFVKNGQKIVNVAKGVEEKTLLTLSEIIEQELPQTNVSVLSGPSHAEEVGKGLPTTCVVSSHQRETAEYLQGIFMSPVFRVYTTPDMLGVELGAALKNVIALAAGTADGLGYGDNTKAAVRADDYCSVLQGIIREIQVCFCDNMDATGFQIRYYAFIVDDRTQSEDWFLFCVDQLVDFVHCSFDAEAEACCLCYFNFHK